MWVATNRHQPLVDRRGGLGRNLLADDRTHQGAETVGMRLQPARTDPVNNRPQVRINPAQVPDRGRPAASGRLRTALVCIHKCFRSNRRFAKLDDDPRILAHLASRGNTRVIDGSALADRMCQRLYGPGLGSNRDEPAYIPHRCRDHVMRLGMVQIPWQNGSRSFRRAGGVSPLISRHDAGLGHQGVHAPRSPV